MERDEIDNILKEIDFTDDPEQEINDKINEMLQDIMSDFDDTVERIFIFEKLLLIAQSQLMPFIEKIVDFKSFKKFSEVKNSFEYVLKCWRGNRMRPYPELEYYIDLSYETAIIVGDDYELLLEEDESIKEKYPEQDILRLQDEWYSEIEQKDLKTQIVAECAYDILEAQYYFLCYFATEDIIEERIIDLCETQIDIILFDILWNIDVGLGNKIERSYFGKAVKDIFIRWRQ